MKQPTHNLQVESRKDKEGKGLLYFNFNYGYYDISFQTGKKCYKPLKFSTGYRLSNEDLKGQSICHKYIKANGRDIRTDLEKLESECYQCLKNYVREHKQVPSPNILKQLVRQELSNEPVSVTSDSILDFIEKLIESNKHIPSTARGYLSASTIVEYRNTKNKLGVLERNNGVKFTFGTYTREKYYESLEAINDIEIKRQIESGEVPTGYTNNYMSRISKNILSILNKSEDDGLKIQFNTRGKKVNEVEAKCNTYFTEEELNLIIEYDVSFSKIFQSAKDFIIISSLTGLRLDDMKNLHQVSVESFGENDSAFKGIKTLIRKVSKAHSKVTAVIPVFGPVMDIYKANHNSFPKFQSNMSDYIKKLCKYLNINNEVEEKILFYLEDEPRVSIKPKYKMVNAHKCRNTFVTNLKKLGVSNVLIGEITHPKKDLSNMQSRYDNSSTEDNARLLINQINEKKTKLFYMH